MNTLAAILFSAAVALPSTTLILRSGQNIDIDGPIKRESGRVIFRSQGTLFSIPLSEIDFSATRGAEVNVTNVTALSADSNVPAVKGDERIRLKVSQAEKDRLLRDLEQNHSGTAAQPITMPLGYSTDSGTPVNREEWTWRGRAREYEDSVRRAEEERNLLVSRVEQLKQQITGFLNLGYKPSQFSYQTTELQTTIDQIPRAELEVSRAKRAYDQFRDDARRQGVTPGWLR